MVNLPRIREHIGAADFQTIAAFLPPAKEGRTLAVSSNEKAVVLRRKRVVDMFSGHAKPLRENDEAVVASLRKYQMVIGFGDCSDSHYNLPPTRIHALRPAFRMADGEEVRSMTVAITFALIIDDRANVEKLMAVNAASADAITVSDLAASLPDLPQLIAALVASQSLDAPSIKTADRERVERIERQILLAADGTLREYGLSADRASLNVISTSRDAELSLPEEEREADAGHRRKLADLHREDERLERQIQSMEKRLETERLERQAEKMRTEILEERLRQSRIQAEIERLDPKIGGAPANGEPEPESEPEVARPPAPSKEAGCWLNATAAGVTLHEEDCVHVRNWAKPPNWKRFSTKEDAIGSTHREIRECRYCRPRSDGGGNVPDIARETLEDANRRDASGRTRLHRAAEAGRADLVRNLAASGARVNVKDKEGFTPLHSAADAKTAQALIDAGANPDAQDSRGNTPLHYINNADMARTLIAAGANLNAQDDYGQTPLHNVADAKTARALIDAGANPNAENDYGNTPLHYPADLKTAQALIDAGANPNAENNYGNTPLHYARDPELARALTNAGANPDAKNDYDQTPLQEAVSSYKTELAQTLIAAGANPNLKYGDDPLLFWAVAVGKTELAQALIAAGADPDAKGDDGRTPLQLAVAKDRNRRNRIELASALIVAGADINATGDDPVHLLFWAASRSQTEMTQALIAAGVDTNAKDSKGRTPLHLAMAGDKLDLAQALIDAGADINAKSKDGRTPLRMSIFWNKPEMAQALIDAGADINAKSNDGKSLLEVAMAQHRFETAQALIDAGAEIDDAKNNDVRTPFHRAADGDKTIIAQELIDADSDSDAQDNLGNTPLHNAAAANLEAEHDHVSTPSHCARDPGSAQELIASGGNMDADDDGGQTPHQPTPELGRSKAERAAKDAGKKPNWSGGCAAVLALFALAAALAIAVSFCG